MRNIQEIENRYIVKQKIEMGDLDVIRVESAIGETPNDNIFALQKNGDVVWRVEAYMPEKGRDNPYMYIEKKDDTLVAHCWMGIFVVVDAASGKIVEVPPQRPW